MRSYSCAILLAAGLLLLSVLAYGQKGRARVPKQNTRHRNTTTTFTKGYAKVNGLNLYYEIYGAGKPLVLIHGGGSTIGTTFGRVIPILARQYQVIAVELQAHGHTADIDRPLSFEQDAGDVAALLQQLGIAKADFFGFSNGGTTVFQLAIRHPELTGKIIVASAIYKKANAPDFLWDLIRDARFETMPKELKAAYLAINPREQDLVKMHDRDLARMRSFTDIPDSAIAGIKAKTLILTGDKDVLTIPQAGAMQQLMANASLMVLPGGHGAYIGEITTPQQDDAYYEAVVLLLETFLKDK